MAKRGITGTFVVALGAFVAVLGIARASAFAQATEEVGRGGLTVCVTTDGALCFPPDGDTDGGTSETPDANVDDGEALDGSAFSDAEPASDAAETDDAGAAANDGGTTSHSGGGSSGCGCLVADAGSGSPGLLWISAALALLVARRSRRSL
jgi:MYXO-CTERM domain-containing protein